MDIQNMYFGIALAAYYLPTVANDIKNLKHICQQYEFDFKDTPFSIAYYGHARKNKKTQASAAQSDL